MTPKEKAKELVYKYNFLKEIFIPSIHEQKQCALIAIDEMLEFTKRIEKSTLTICTPDGCFCDETIYYNDYLIDVKKEIEML
jgi:hypothetical protein